MTSRADQYRRQAQEAEEDAYASTEPLARVTLYKIARKRRNLAKQVA